MSYTRKGNMRSEMNNNTLFNRRFMMGNKDIPDHSVIKGPQDSNFLGARIRPHDSVAQKTEMSHGDYSLFLRSFDSNQRLTQANNEMITHEMDKYKQTYRDPHEVRALPTQSKNLAYNPYAGNLDRQGVQTRYNSRKGEQLCQNLAAKQQELSYTPQTVQDKKDQQERFHYNYNNQYKQLWPYQEMDGDLQYQQMQ